MHLNWPKKDRAAGVTSATKSNGIKFTMPYWDERFNLMAEQYPDISRNQFHIDILTAHFVLHPDWFDVVVASNLFGDICPTWPGHCRRHRHRPLGQPERG